MPPTEEQSAARHVARAELWRRGDLRYLLDANQLADRAAIWSRPTDDYVLDVARQTGKSWLCCVLALEYCLTHKGAQVKYASLTQKSVRAIVEPTIAAMLEDCPSALRPLFDAQQSMWRFRDSSMITAAGTDSKHYVALRGQRADLIIKDEAGFFAEPEEVDAVLTPQRLTTGGIIIEASTPPITPGHPFTARAAAAKAQGRYSHRTIYEHARLTREQVDAFLAREADLRGLSLDEFKKTATFRREFLAEHVVDETRAVIPEWSDRGGLLTCSPPRPKLCDTYVSLDWGWRDGMAALFGYWDFRRATLVIEDELLLFKSTTAELARNVKEIEARLWPATEPKPYLEAKKTDWNAWEPFRRVADNDLLAINDLAARDGLAFSPTRKDDKELQVNELRRMVAASKIEINPRCRRLISQLAATIWNLQRTSYERSHEGHGDLLDALVYLVRNLARERNPEPRFHGADPSRQWIPDEPAEDLLSLRSAFGEPP